MTVAVDIHPFEKAGYGPAPYDLQGQTEDEECGLTCDSCGKTGLRYKFQLLSSTDQLFGVGSECIKKADPDMWLLMKSHYGAKSNISASAVERREAYDEAHAKFLVVVLGMELGPSSWFHKEYKCSQPFDSVKRCHTKTFYNEAERLQNLITISNEKEAQRLKDIEEIARLYRLRPYRLDSGPVNEFARACLVRPEDTDYLKRKDVYRSLALKLLS